MIDLFTAPIWSNLLVLGGLCWAVVVSARLVFGRQPADVGKLSPGPVVGLGVPLTLVAGGFLVSGATHPWWTVAVVGAVSGLSVTARVRFTAGSARGYASAAAALAVLTTAGVLVEFGALMTVRLVVGPDPADPFVAALRVDSLVTGLLTVGVPLAGVVVAAVALAWLPNVVRRRAGRGRPDPLVERATGDGTGTDDAPTGSRTRRLSIRAGAVLLVVVPFALPLAGGAGDGAALTFAWIATPEFGKLVFLAVMAALVARLSHRFDITRGPIRPGRSGVRQPRRGGWTILRARRYALYPLALFSLVAVASGGRRDFGTVVSVLAATVGVTWAAARFNMVGKPDAELGGLFVRTTRRLRRTLRAYLPFVGFGAVLLIVTACVALTMTDYVGERGQIWADPWAYRWDSGCVRIDDPPPATGPAANGPAANGPVAVDGRGDAPVVPDGWVRCQRSRLADVESGRSQLARALSAVADGGLWGRGLMDTTSSVVPAGSTDFMLVVIWHKLGGIAVLLAATLTILLGIALPRAVRGPTVDPGRGPSVGELFAAGLGAMIVGQFLFVFAATVNVLPHSGLPAPLLSRGGQSNLAVLIGVLAVLMIGTAVRGGAPTGPCAPGHPRVPGHVPAPGSPRRRGGSAGRLGLAVPLGLCLVIVVGETLVPYWAPAPAFSWHPVAYDSKRMPCPARHATREALTSPQPDPRHCTTDRLAYQRTVIEIRFGSRRGLVRNRPAETWSVLSDPALGGLTGEDLAGLLRVGTGRAGALELSHSDVVFGSAGTDLRQRLSPRTGRHAADGGLSLTLDPALQHAVALAMRSDEPDGTLPLAGGAVVLDATSGRILASVTVPGQPSPPVVPRPGPRDRRLIERFESRYPYYGQVTPDGGLDGSVGNASCAAGHGDTTPCWRWSIQRTGAELDAAGEADLRRYVADDPTVALPPVSLNRAVGGRYDLGGSIIAVVVAAAYLEQPGTSATDQIPAGGGCRGATGNRISLARALAVSCATAFTALAASVGWPRIAAQARRFGLSTGDCADVGAWMVRPLAGSAGTCLSADVRGTTVGNPLGLATVMAAVSNRGIAVQPRLVDSTTPPHTHRVVTTPVGETHPALKRDAAVALDDELRRGAVDGTTVRLRESLGDDGWGMAGVAELPTVTEAAGAAGQPGRFADRHVWFTGYLRTDRGPVAFAVVLECRDEQHGKRRARYVLDAISRTIGR